MGLSGNGPAGRWRKLGMMNPLIGRKVILMSWPPPGGGTVPTSVILPARPATTGGPNPRPPQKRASYLLTFMVRVGAGMTWMALGSQRHFSFPTVASPSERPSLGGSYASAYTQQPGGPHPGGRGRRAYSELPVSFAGGVRLYLSGGGQRGRGPGPGRRLSAPHHCHG